jgi:diacylglycerol kinase (ATP)
MTHLTGFPLYLAAVYRTFGAFEPPDLEVTAEEHRERGRMMMLAVSIGTTAGGGFRLTPEASPDDGLFDVCLVRQVGLARFLRYVPTVARGRHAGIREVSMFRTSRITVSGLSGPLTTHLDGELRCPEEETIHIEIVPRCLAVLCL